MKLPESHRRVFVLFLSVVTIAFFWVLLPFYGAVFWALILALMFMPLNNFILAKMPKRRNIAAALTLLVCFLIVILPMAAVAIAISQESAGLYQKISTLHVSSEASFRYVYNRLPHWALSLLYQSGITSLAKFQQSISGGLLDISHFIASKIFEIGQNVLDFAIGFCLMLYVLFFLLRDGNNLAGKIMNILPLADHHKGQLMKKFIGVIRATVKGNLVVAVAQGISGALIFWILDIDAPLLWGALMSFMSLLPCGSSIIWGPFAIYLLVSGALVKGIVLLVFGVLVIGVVDNLLRPILVGKDTQMPDYLVLISTIGGMALLGLNGLIIGPVIAALFLTAWELYAAVARMPEKDGKNDLPGPDGK